MDRQSELLELASRCVLAFPGSVGPLLSPMAFWADGSALWMSTPAASVKAKALITRPRCAAFVADPDDPDSGIVLTGDARVYGWHDPVGLAVHAPVVSAAMTALAGRNVGSVWGYLQDAADVPRRFRPHNRVAVRVGIRNADAVRRPRAAPGVAPPLPVTIPPDMRRALSGRREVVVATQDVGGDVVVAPGVWGEGYRLQLAGRHPAPARTRCAVHVGEDPRRRPTGVAGVCLTGDLADGRFTPRRATWWEGFALRSADVPPPSTALVLPE